MKRLRGDELECVGNSSKNPMWDQTIPPRICCIGRRASDVSVHESSQERNSDSGEFSRLLRRQITWTSELKKSRKIFWNP